MDCDYDYVDPDEILSEEDQLLLAAEKGEEDVVGNLIDAGANINCSHVEYKFTALHYASKNGWLGIVQSLLQKGANLDAEAYDRDTPLLLAARQKHANIVELLISAGANIHCADKKYRYSMLHYAAINGWPEMVLSLLKKGYNIDVESIYRETPMHMAGRLRHEHIVRLFINEGASVKCFDEKYRFALLHYASKNGWLEIVRIALEKGADFDIRAFNGDSPMILAARAGFESIVRLLINAGANVNFGGLHNYTALHFACRNNWPEIVQLLLKKGADMEVKNTNSETAMLLAAKIGRRDIAKLLFDAGADTDVNCSDINSPFFTLLYFCALDGWFEMAQIILEKSADKHIKTRSAQISLVRAASIGDVEFVELLLKAGVDVNSPDTELNCFTPLHVSSVCGEFETVRCLLEHGANVDAKCTRDRTSLQYACEYYKADVVELLIKAGADVMVEFNYGKSLLADVLTLIHSISNVKLVGTLLFKGRGVYIKTEDYKEMLESSVLTEQILQDSEFCSQSVINHFNLKLLPELYKLPVACETLPPIEHMRIGSKCQVAQEALQSAKHEIQVKGHCNVLKARPIALKLLCVRSFLAYCDNVKNRNGQTKRSAEWDCYDRQSPNKVMRWN